MSRSASTQALQRSAPVLSAPQSTDRPVRRPVAYTHSVGASATCTPCTLNCSNSSCSIRSRSGCREGVSARLRHPRAAPRTRPRREQRLSNQHAALAAGGPAELECLVRGCTAAAARRGAAPARRRCDGTGSPERPSFVPRRPEWGAAAALAAPHRRPLHEPRTVSLAEAACPVAGSRP